MGFRVTIVDSDSGKIVHEFDNARSIIGAIGDDKGVHALTCLKCNPITLYSTISGVQEMLIKLNQDHPELEMIAQLKNLADKIDKSGIFGNKSGD